LEESTLKGFRICSRCFEGPETEEAIIFLIVNRARNNFRKCSIERIIVPDDRVLTTKEDISREITSHFTAFFNNQPSSDTLAGTEFLEEIRDCSEDLPNLTSPISTLEIKSDFLATKKNKSLGTDGIP
jgi:hypothetical protein